MYCRSNSVAHVRPMVPLFLIKFGIRQRLEFIKLWKVFLLLPKIIILPKCAEIAVTFFFINNLKIRITKQQTKKIWSHPEKHVIPTLLYMQPDINVSASMFRSFKPSPVIILDGVGPVDTRPSTNKLHQLLKKKMTSDTRHVTRDMWHMTFDTWHIGGGGTMGHIVALPYL